MPGWFIFGAGLFLPLMFWVCRWQGWPFWLCGLVLLPLILPSRSSNKTSILRGRMRYVPGILAAFIGVAAIVFKSGLTLQFYSVLSGVFFFAIFAGSLTQDQNIIERFARRFEPNFPPHAVHYTRRVTQAWCVFHALNTVVTLLCIRAGDVYWAWYNGLISYVLMGAMFVGEWIIRKWFLRHLHTAPAD
ncbi:MAG: hypothetical protein LBG78_06030 [Azoarcus sp.]|jgi:uncharacterized membrane protein|nr:hypothetical protein [Azoarcus sp.]